MSEAINILASIESVLSIHLRPHFLSVTKEEEVISIIVSHPSFSFLAVSERISKIFDLLKLHNPVIFNQTNVVVQAFSEEELEDLFEYWVDDDI